MSETTYNRRRLLGFSLANLFFGGLPRRASYVLMAVVGWVVATILPGRVAGLRSNLEHVFPDYTRAQVTDLMQRNAKNYGKFWVDLFKMPRLPRDYKNGLATIEGEDNWKAAMAPGKGCVVVTLHMGGWEGCASLWGSSSPYRTGLIAEVLEPPELWQKVLRLRESSGLSIIPLSRTAPRDILRRLKNNEMVAGAIDRDLLGSGRPFRFFSGTIDVPTGLVDIAQRTGAAVLPVVCYRRPDDTYTFIGMEPIWVGQEAGAVDDTVRRVLRLFEDCIRRFPDQWHVMVPIFKSEPQTLARPVPARVAVMPGVDLEERVG
ncbi:MAG: phosphatidylinositol dimannoside acyltransferase [Chloroflexota bacterium]|jgi:KDO2-lipid IV(A) lauroyltransferase|nr:phosphatidylinositol dimannoside acyltransferase [Chloroflexota bacterium]